MTATSQVSFFQDPLTEGMRIEDMFYEIFLVFRRKSVNCLPHYKSYWVLKAETKFEYVRFWLSLRAY